MSEMIERVARALYEQDHEAAPLFEGAAHFYRWDGPNFKGQDYFRHMARAAIEAMREPTDAMCYAAGITQDGAGTYREMIRSALTNGDGK